MFTKILCPACETRLRVSQNAMGRESIVCPRCKVSFEPATCPVIGNKPAEEEEDDEEEEEEIDGITWEEALRPIFGLWCLEVVSLLLLITLILSLIKPINTFKNLDMMSAIVSGMFAIKLCFASNEAMKSSVVIRFTGTEKPLVARIVLIAVAITMAIATPLLIIESCKFIFNNFLLLF